MMRTLKKKLVDAEGRSEFIIAVFCDIRGFSAFSAQNEATDTAMFIRRFYIELLDNYFKNAVFAKPAGDGLLVIYRYSEKTLKAVSHEVLDACFRALEQYRSMFDRDPMINYSIPGAIGIGVARGSASCLYAGKTIIDYSGAIVNLASRLNDYARPKGIVIDGKFLLDVVSEEFRALLAESNVYIRGIAEKEAVPIFHTKEVVLPQYALRPIQDEVRKTMTKELKVSDIALIRNNYHMTIPSPPDVGYGARVEVVWPLKKPKGHTRWQELTKVEFTIRPENNAIKISMDEVRTIISKAALSKRSVVTLRATYVEK